MKREIVMFGSQILRKSCPPVKEVDDDIRALVSDLFDSMRAAEGIGLGGERGRCHGGEEDKREEQRTQTPVASCGPACRET